MEPGQDETKKDPQRRPEEKRPRHFRLIRLEERIAPRAGGNKTNNSNCVILCNLTQGHCGVF
jgi:hypothetical protein